MTRLSWAVWLVVRIASGLIVAIAIAIALTAPAPAFTERCGDDAGSLSDSGRLRASCRAASDLHWMVTGRGETA